MTVKEIDQQISLLKMQREDLQRQEYAEFVAKARANVGRCFKSLYGYEMIVDVPPLKVTATDMSYNQYQYPSICIRPVYSPLTRGIPVYESMVFFGAWGDGNNVIPRNYEEVSQKEFEEAFDEAVAKFKHRLFTQKS